ICDRAGHEALKKLYGTTVGMTPEEIKNERLIVYWGMNPAWTNLHGFSLVKKYGLEVWTVDVRVTPTMKASSRGFILKPGRDAEFALYIAKAMVENGWYEKSFAEDYIENFNDFKSYLSGLEWDRVKRMGLSKKDVLDFARGFWEKRGVIHIGYGFQRSRNGGTSVLSVGILPVLSGHKCGFLYDMKTLDKSYAEGRFLRKTPIKTIPQMKIAEYIENGDIEMVYIYDANPLNSHQNVNRLRKAFEKIFVVVHDIFMTETAIAADVVLPANTFFERLDVVDSYYHDYILLNEPVMRLYGYSNREITMMLSKKLGFEDEHLYESEEKIIEKVLKDSGLSWEELKERKVIKGRKISRCRDKIRVYFDNLKEAEEIDIKEDEFILISPTHYSTITSQYYTLHDKFDGQIYMNPEDGKKVGINEGDMAEVFNEYGGITSRVKFSEDIQKGTVVIFKGSWQNLHGRNVNVLVGDEVQEDYGNASIYHGFRVRVRKI
ncbi:MAG: molybdopterin-dependent oxidoreductase, partial [Thermotogaceae bacterium]|nr:molybdopterin-dependent oxidoreductase [Thermotogaceae bacterium]